MKDIEDEVSLKMCEIILDRGKNSTYYMFLLNTKCWNFILDILLHNYEKLRCNIYLL